MLLPLPRMKRISKNIYRVPEMSMRAFSTRSVVQTSSSPQSLKKGIWADVWGSEALSFVEIGKKEWENWPRMYTYRLIDGVLPSFIQHRASLSVVDLKPQGEANRTDVIRCVLTNKKRVPLMVFSQRFWRMCVPTLTKT